MRRIVVIGIGAGDPAQLTMEAAEAIAAADVFLVIDKGEATADLRGLRDELLRRHARPGHRVVDVPEVPRDRSPADYDAAVDDWHAARAGRIGAAIRDEVADGGTGAFLVWGDPSLYDSTLRILDRVADAGVVSFRRSVVPGVSSLHALAARAGIALHGIGEPFLVTTGRRLADDIDLAPNVVVLLDGRQAFLSLVDAGGARRSDLEIVWAAYLGLPHEVLVRGRLDAVADEIAATRAAAREAHGWIMDVYLLRKVAPEG